MFSLQTIPPDDAHFCLQIEAICRKRLGLDNGGKVVVALSGGSDSIACALVMRILAPRLNLSVSSLHLNHGLRPSAAHEAAFTQQFCDRIGMPCTIAKIAPRHLAIQRHCGIEEASRIARYSLMEEHRLEIGADYIILGHQADDLCEDIFLRILRGAGWPALSGMAWKTGRILRPLLHTSRDRLKDFVTSLGFQWINDESNQSLAYRRNRIRHLLMPLLRCENPAIGTSLPRLHEMGRIDAEYWRDVLDAALQKNPWLMVEHDYYTELVLPKALLADLHPAARLRLYHRALAVLRENAHLRGQTRADNLLRLDEIYKTGTGGKTIQCSGGITASTRQGAIILCRDDRNWDSE